MTLTGGIATGIVTWGVNEPLIYYGNVWGELNQLGIEAGTPNAAIFAMARTFYNWTFVPYAIYALCGLLVSYIYYHKKDSLTVTATLKPLFGDRVTKPLSSAIIDTLSMLALTIGSLQSDDVSRSSLPVLGHIRNPGKPSLCCRYRCCYNLHTFSSYVGLDKGLKIVGSLNAWFYYGLLALPHNRPHTFHSQDRNTTLHHGCTISGCGDLIRSI